MRITYYSCEPSKAQEATINSLNGIVVRPALVNPNVVATISTPLGQSVNITLDEMGIIKQVELKEENKMTTTKQNKLWVLCECPECEGKFTVSLEQTRKQEPNDLFGLKPLPEDLTCPYCGIKNDIYAVHFPKVAM